MKLSDCGFKQPSGLISVATSKKASVVNMISIFFAKAIVTNSVFDVWYMWESTKAMTIMKVER